jgi:nucleotidyltransferase substrate binding protein (TIGR01987 family)
VIVDYVKNDYSWYTLFLELKKILDKFEKVFEYKKEQFPCIVEAAILIFRHAFELYWKLFKKICLAEGREVNSPRSALQQAYAIGLINHEQVWLEIMEDRNLTSHTYKQPTANLIYTHCQQYLPVMQTTYKNIEKRFQLI